MSVVASIMTQDLIIVGYDGRAARDGVIISENTIKAHKLNKNVCLGYTGSLEIAERFVDVLLSVENRTAAKSALCEDVLGFILKNIERYPSPSDLYVQFIIAGLSRTGSFCTMTVKPGGSPNITFAKHGEKIYSVLSTNKPDEHNLYLSEFVQREIAKSGKVNIAYEAGIKHFIEAVSNVDHSVNRNVSYIELTR